MRRSPSDDESAAIAAAIERFVAETAPAPPDEETVGPWQRAALLEGVSAKGTVDRSEGGGRWLS